MQSKQQSKQQSKWAGSHVNVNLMLKLPQRGKHRTCLLLIGKDYAQALTHCSVEKLRDNAKRRCCGVFGGEIGEPTTSR